MLNLEAPAQVVLEQILFLTDFSPCAALAFPYAKSLARRYGSNLILAHILPPMPIAPPLETMEASYRAAKQEIETFLGPDALGDIPYEVVLERGELWPALSNVITQHKIDLIVLATHGRHGIGKLLLGSVAEQVFRLAACPVLTVGPNTASPEAEITRILFATDFPWSMHALPYALSLAKKNHAYLALLHVLPEPRIAVAAGGTYEARGWNEAEATQELENLIPLDEGDPYLQENCEVLVDYGAPAESILTIAGEKQAELIVMGVRHASSLVAATHLPWSTAHKVVAQAPCPVLTVRE